MYDVFLSYSSHDRPFTLKLQAALLAAGKTVWLDRNDILPAQAWDQAAYVGIDASHNFLVVVSPDSIGATKADGSPAPCKLEYDRAVAAGKRLIPLHYRTVAHEALQPELRKVNDIDFRGTDTDDALFGTQLQVLLHAIDTNLPWLMQQTVLELRAEQWQQREKDPSRLLRGDELQKFELWLAQSPNQPTQPTPLQTQYLLASRQARIRAHRRNLWIIWAVCVVLAGATIFSTLEGITALKEAQLATSGSLAASAVNLESTQPDLAALLAVEGYRVLPSFDTLNALLTVTQSTASMVTTLRAPSGSFTAVKAIPNSSRFLTGSSNGELELWDSVEAQPIVLTKGSAGDSIMQIAFAADAQTFAVVYQHRHVEVWKLSAQGATLESNEFASVPSNPNGIAFSADGKLLAVSGLGMQVYTLADHHALRAVFEAGTAQGPDRDSMRGTAFLPNHPTMLAEADYYGGVVFEDAVTRQSLGRAMTAHPSSGHFALSNDGEMLAVDQTDSVDLFRVAVAGGQVSCTKLYQLISGDNASVQSFAFTPNGKTLAIATAPNTIRIWNTETGTVIREQQGPAEGVTLLAFGGDQRMLFAAAADDAMQVFDVQPRDVTELAATNDGTQQGAGNDPVEQLAISYDNHLLAAASYEATTLWDLRTKKRIRTLNFEGPTHLEFTADGKYLYETSDQLDHSTRTDLATMVTKLVAEQYQGSSGTHGRSAYGLASAVSTTGMVATVVTELGSGPMGQAGPGEAEPLRGVVLTDPTAPGHPVRLSAPDLQTGQLVFSADGKYLAATGTTQHLWSVGNGVAVAMRLDQPTLRVDSLRFSQDGSLLLGIGPKGFQVWKTVTGHFLSNEPNHMPGDVRAIGMSPLAGFVALTIGNHNEILFADPESRRQLGLPLQAAVKLKAEETAANSLSFSPDGTLLAYGEPDGSVRLWDANPKDWMAHACRVAHRNLTRAEWDRYLPGTRYRETCPSSHR